MDRPVSTHLNSLAKKGATNEALPEEDVETEQSGGLYVDRESFARLTAAESVGLGLFPYLRASTMLASWSIVLGARSSRSEWDRRSLTSRRHP